MFDTSRTQNIDEEENRIEFVQTPSTEFFIVGSTGLFDDPNSYHLTRKLISTVRPDVIALGCDRTWGLTLLKSPKEDRDSYVKRHSEKLERSSTTEALVTSHHSETINILLNRLGSRRPNLDLVGAVEEGEAIGSKFVFIDQNALVQMKKHNLLTRSGRWHMTKQFLTLVGKVISSRFLSNKDPDLSYLVTSFFRYRELHAENLDEDEEDEEGNTKVGVDIDTKYFVVLRFLKMLFELLSKEAYRTIIDERDVFMIDKLRSIQDAKKVVCVVSIEHLEGITRHFNRLPERMKEIGLDQDSLHGPTEEEEE